MKIIPYSDVHFKKNPLGFSKGIRYWIKRQPVVRSAEVKNQYALYYFLFYLYLNH